MAKSDNVRRVSLLLILICVIFWYKWIIILYRNQNDGRWVDIVIGYPNFSYLKAKKIVAKKWNITYEYETRGCIMTWYNMQEAKNRDSMNERYFKELAVTFGKDWRDKFDAEVDEQVAKIKFEKERRERELFGGPS